jgi:hypothetical protein
MKLPDLQKLTKRKDSNPYATTQPTSKKTFVLMMAGVLALLGLVGYLLLSSGGASAGSDMRSSLEDTGDLIAALNTYDKDLQFADSKNTAALANSLLVGDYKAINELYGKTYGAKKKLPVNPKLSSEDKTALDSAKNANQIDSELFTYLRPKLVSAHTALTKARLEFTKEDSLVIIDRALVNLKTISDLLNQSNAVTSAR